MLQQEALVCIFRKSSWFIDYLQSIIYFYLSFLDVDDVKFVINYDFPSAVEDYIHRSFLPGLLTTFVELFSFLAIASLCLVIPYIFSQ